MCAVCRNPNSGGTCSWDGRAPRRRQCCAAVRIRMLSERLRRDFRRSAQRGLRSDEIRVVPKGWMTCTGPQGRSRDEQRENMARGTVLALIRTHRLQHAPLRDAAPQQRRDCRGTAGRHHKQPRLPAPYVDRGDDGTVLAVGADHIGQRAVQCSSASPFDSSDSKRINTLPRRSASNLRAEKHSA